MHFEILVEGQSERTALEPLLTKIIGSYNSPHTWRIHKHRGVGKLPDLPRDKPNPKDPTLLHNLPSKLRAYGKSLGSEEFVIVLVDLDNRQDCETFKGELLSLLDFCSPQPNCLIRIAIEELEAWYFGDINALQQAYPTANVQEMASYVQDSQCGTWEKMAETIYPGGLAALKTLGPLKCLAQKRIWAREIAPRMDVENNNSESFRCFRDGLRNAARILPTP